MRKINKSGLSEHRVKKWRRVSHQSLIIIAHYKLTYMYISLQIDVYVYFVTTSASRKYAARDDRPR